MPVSLECAEITGWKTLFGDTVGPEQRQRHERHLETCPACRERLDLSLLGAVRQFGHPVAANTDPTLTGLLERLYDVGSPMRPNPPEPLDLYFLRPSDCPDLLGTLGAYEVREVIGQGGMGIVLKGFEPALNRVVAIKVLAPALAGSATARRRFTREAQAAAVVCHEHVVAVYGVHETDGLPCMVMQYVAGESLQDRLDRSGPLETIEAVRIGMQTAAGLAAAHAQGLIHRDIKPANLLLENGLARVRISDFGLARMVDDVGLTQAGVVTGTPQYMAPEQARGEPVDYRADLFSLGSVLYAMCTGSPPFRGTATLALLRQVSEQEPAPVRSLNPDMPAWLEGLIMRLLAKDPARRLGSAAEVAALLEGYLAHLRQPTATPAPELPPLPDACVDKLPEPSLPSRAARWFRRPLGLAVLTALLALGSAMAWWWAGDIDKKEPRPTKFHRDFRALDPRDEALRPIGLGGSADDRGVRIILPAGQGVPPHSGYMSGFAVQGDFEATFAFEVLKANTPDKGYGVGVSLYAALDPKIGNAASLAWRAMTDGQTKFVSDRLMPIDGKLTHKVKMMPATSAAGKLRLKRVGSKLRYLVADGLDAEFIQLDEVEFGTADVRPIQVGGNTGNADAGLDFRLLSFTVHAEEDLPGLAEVSAEPTDQPGKGWLAAAALIGLVILATAAAGAWFHLRHAGKHPHPAQTALRASTPEAPAQADAVSPTISFLCQTCQKMLRAKSALAGKKLKCPQCGGAVLVPSIQQQIPDKMSPPDAMNK
jgi:serine/threonine protein kinase